MFSDNMIRTDKKQGTEISKRDVLLRVKPLVDIYETENDIVVMLEMPNVKKDGLRVQVENGFLHITGRRENEQIQGEYIFRETRDVLFERIFELEDNLDTNRISASYELGVLKVSIGKKEKAKPRVIEVN